MSITRVGLISLHIRDGRVTRIDWAAVKDSPYYKLY